MQYTKGSIYFAIYILLAFCFGFYWFTIKSKLNSLEISEPVLRFSIRFLFGLGYLALAMIYCKLSKKPLYLQIVSQIYLLFELSILTLGLFRYFVIDNPLIISLYSTLLGLTVSPLGLLFTHVIISLKKKKSLLDLE